VTISSKKSLIFNEMIISSVPGCYVRNALLREWQHDLAFIYIF